MTRPTKYNQLSLAHQEYFEKLGHKYKYTKHTEATADDLIKTKTNILVHHQAYHHFLEMNQQANLSGVNLHIVSGFRSIDDQVTAFFGDYKGVCDRVDYFFENDDFDQVQNAYHQRLQWVAPPFFSEHHTGKAFDFCVQQLHFEDTPEFIWLTSNAHKYGFRMSYPKNSTTGCNFEPWHWFFVG